MSFVQEPKDLVIVGSSPIRRLPQKLAVNKHYDSVASLSNIPDLSQLSMGNYRSRPKARTRSELIVISKAEMMKQAVESSSCVFVSPSKRGKKRERKFRDHSCSQESVLLERRKERNSNDLANFEQKLSCNVYGIHKGELPKFYEIREKLLKTHTTHQIKNELKLPERSRFNETKPPGAFSVISRKIDMVEFIEMKRNANFRPDNFKILKDATLTPYFQKKLESEEAIKGLRKSIRFRKSLLIQK